MTTLEPVFPSRGSLKTSSNVATNRRDLPRFDAITPPLLDRRQKVVGCRAPAPTRASRTGEVQLPLSSSAPLGVASATRQGDVDTTRKVDTQDIR